MTEIKTELKIFKLLKRCDVCNIEFLVDTTIKTILEKEEFAENPYRRLY